MTLGTLVLITLVVLYFIPAFVAAGRKRKNTGAIVVTNILFGWTFVGWGVALIWAFKND